MPRLTKPKPGSTGLVADLYKGIKKGLTSSEAKKLADMLNKTRNLAQTKAKTIKKDKIKESASAFVKRRKQLSASKGAAGKMAQRTGPSKKEVIGYGAAAGAGLLASSQIKKRRKKKEK